MNEEICQMVDEAVIFLERSQPSEARREAEMLLAHDLGCRKSEVYWQESVRLSQEFRCRFRDHLCRRKAGEPLQYILGTQGFHEIEVAVKGDVFIPRPETEILVEAIAREIRGMETREMIQVLDLCTGSGNIAIALAIAFPHVAVDAVEISPATLEVTRANVEKHHLTQRIRIFLGDLFAPLLTNAPQPGYDFIVSNPPYIASDEIAQLPQEVRDYEPRLALDGGSDGLRVLARIVEEAPHFLRPHGRIFLEGGADQERKIPLLFAQNPQWKRCEVIRDFNQQPRVFWSQRSG